MSKSTDRYGKVMFTARLTADGEVQPTKKLLRQREKLEKAAMKAFKGTHYKDLTDPQKSKLHLDMALARVKARDRETAKATADPVCED